METLSTLLMTAGLVLGYVALATRLLADRPVCQRVRTARRRAGSAADSGNEVGRKTAL